MSNDKDRTDEEKEYYALTKKVWDILAPYYNVINLLLFRLRGTVVAFTDATQGSEVLDVATGTGKQAYAFAKKGFDVIGIDISESMLRIANKKNKYPNAKFQLADATDLPFADGRFDVVCISFALHDMPSTIQEKVLMEMARVTRAGGRIVIVDYGLPRNKIGKFFVYHLIKFYEREYYVKFIRSDLRALIKNAGIEIIAEASALLGVARIIKGGKAED